MAETERKPKEFVRGMWIDRFDFPRGGSKLRVAFKVDVLIEFLRDHQNERGYVNADIFEKQQRDENGSHYCVLDTWKPDPTKARTRPPPAAQPDQAEPPPTADPLPF